MEAPGEGETEALNESHMFPKWRLSGQPGLIGPVAPLRAHTRHHLAPLRHREARFTFAAERESAVN